jgi:cell division transport system ATP-binding protein
MSEESTLLVETSGLCVQQEDNRILENVNLKVDVGEFVYFIGKVGSGKSSMLKTLYAELEIPEGNATVAGFELADIRPKQIPLLRRKIGMVFQDFELMSDRNVYENLSFVLKATDWTAKNDIDIRINEVLESVGMLDKKNSMPSRLSGGEKQSVSIARALLNNPPVIFADEPTGNLDPESLTQIMNTLYKLCESGKSVIMVTHNYNILKKYPGKIYLFENGSVTEQVDEGIDFVDL